MNDDAAKVLEPIFEPASERASRGHESRRLEPAPVLDHIRPTVVRRRVIELQPSLSVAPLAPVTPVELAATGPAAEEDEEGPPSSVDVSRALASLRGADLERLEALMRADDEREGV